MDDQQEYQSGDVVPCHEDCFHYGMFGGVEGCDAGRFHEQIQPGQKCIYPTSRSIGQYVGTFSSLEVCAALEGTPILNPKTGEPGGFTKLLLSLDSEPQKSR